MSAHRYTTETGASMHQRESLPAGSDSCLPTSRSRPSRWMTAIKCTNRARDCVPASVRGERHNSSAIKANNKIDLKKKKASVESCVTLFARWLIPVD